MRSEARIISCNGGKLGDTKSQGGADPRFGNIHRQQHVAGRAAAAAASRSAAASDARQIERHQHRLPIGTDEGDRSGGRQPSGMPADHDEFRVSVAKGLLELIAKLTHVFGGLMQLFDRQLDRLAHASHQRYRFGAGTSFQLLTAAVENRSDFDPRGQPKCSDAHRDRAACER